MNFSLYQATIPSYLQILGSVSGLVTKAEAFCAEKNLACEDLIHACLAEDMLPFGYQVKSTAVHSLGAIEGVRKGVFAPDRAAPPATFAELKSKIADSVAGLESVDPKEIDDLVGRDMRFEFGEHRIEFTAESFLLSFSQPNFYFHAATAYDILRWKGVAIGKRDFLGKLRSKR
jgi:hypothetical protein